jgi:phosphonate metabolism protein PhnN/1,5-bisphosphokinase (PRPP-forming)
MRPAPGRLFAIVGPSGSGKDTLLDGLIRARPDVHRARRTISRPPSDATEGFESVTEAEFAHLCAAGAFALHWPAHGLGYGIRHAEFDPLEEGRTVVFNGSRKALPEAMERFPDLRVIVISVSPEILAARLAARGRETADAITARLSRAALDLPVGRAGTVIPNDGTPDEGIARLLAALQPVSA